LKAETEKTEKTKLRRHWRSLDLPPPEARLPLSRQLVSIILGCVDFKKAPNIGLYFPQGHEPDLTALWQSLPDRCAFPRVENESLVFYRVGDIKQLKPGYGGILEPPEVQAEQITSWNSDDLLLVPGLAFDKHGIRLGSGKGFYDRFLSDSAAASLFWGVCFDERVSPDPLPREPHDIPMHALFTPTRLIVV
jgi:5-formyltetrahydrofolate cyclo-ligase